MSEGVLEGALRVFVVYPNVELLFSICRLLLQATMMEIPKRGFMFLTRRQFRTPKSQIHVYNFEIF